ncbi:MAG: hypothetical protein IJF83_07275 [Methanobrevibacter sp.]|nr:hypothetical protein [Methanobrevibacter sp.]
MSRSRFSIGNVLTKCSGIRKNGKLLTFEEVVQELNKLSGTNDAVEKDHKRLSNQLKEAYGKINELTNENDVLKKELYYYRNEFYDILRYKAIDSYTIHDTFANKYYTLIGPEIADDLCGLLNNYFNETNQLKQSIKKMRGVE